MTHSFSWLGTGTSIKNGSAESQLLVKLCSHASVFNMCIKCQPSHVTKRKECCPNLDLYTKYIYSL